MWRAGLSATLHLMFRTGAVMIDAEHAFSRARRAARLRLLGRNGGALPVFSGPTGVRSARGGLREIPLEAISGTLEPARAAQFDCDFRPLRRSARTRWERIWIAEDKGVLLPPISVVPVGDRFAVRDGHHRVSVARARGAVAIDAIVDAV
jgi:hypothetical protein